MDKIIAVRFFKTELGNEPVKEWLLNLDKEDRKIVGSDIQTVEFGFPIGMPLVRKVDTKYKLWEVRSKLASDKIARVIFTIYKDCMILLHGFIKKDQKMPEKEKNTAIERRKKIDIGSVMKNKHIGSNFTEFLKEDGIYEEVNDIAIKRVIAYQLEQEMKAQQITKTKMAELMKTSRAVVNRLLNPDNGSLTLSTLESATHALGKRLSVSIH